MDSEGSVLLVLGAASYCETHSVWPALMIAPLPGLVTSICFQPAGSPPVKLRFTSTHQFEFWGEPIGA